MDGLIQEVVVMESGVVKSLFQLPANIATK